MSFADVALLRAEQTVRRFDIFYGNLKARKFVRRFPDNCVAANVHRLVDIVLIEWVVKALHAQHLLDDFLALRSRVCVDRAELLAVGQGEFDGVVPEPLVASLRLILLLLLDLGCLVLCNFAAALGHFFCGLLMIFRKLTCVNLHGWERTLRVLS